MKRILIAVDSFKGNRSSLEIGEIIKDTLLELSPSFNIDILPLADGGEGSITSLTYNKKHHVKNVIVNGPNYQKISANYALLDDKIAIIESASVIGLHLKEEGSTPLTSTTYGLGEMILDAIKVGNKNIYICLGGSATNDAGTGMLAALGMKFFNKDNESFIPTGGNLKDIHSIDDTLFKNNTRDVNFYILSDVTNPLVGLKGASYTFAKQKGANEKEVEELENNMVQYVSFIKNKYHKDISTIPSLGAAGGLTSAFYIFMNSHLLSGIDYIMDYLRIDEEIQSHDIIITGEGKLDHQSLEGKVISGVIKRNEKYHKKVIIICGISELTSNDINDKNVIIYPTSNDKFNHLEKSERYKNDLIETVKIIYQKELS